MERVQSTAPLGRDVRRTRRRRPRTGRFVALAAGLALLLPLAPAAADDVAEPSAGPVPEASLSVSEPTAPPTSEVSSPSNTDASTPTEPVSVPQPEIASEPEIPSDSEIAPAEQDLSLESVTDPGAGIPSAPEGAGELVEEEPPAPVEAADADAAVTDSATGSATDVPGATEDDGSGQTETPAPEAGENPAPSPEAAATGTVPGASSPAAPATGDGARPVSTTGGSDTVLAPGARAAALGAAGTVAARGVAASGWSNPVLGRITSSFGMRVHPVLGIASMHAGQDIANACGTPVHAAAAGTVLYVGVGYQGRTGNQVVIDHGEGIITRYGHLLSGSVGVGAGDAVAAGQHIANVGGDVSIDPVGAGNSTGCHLHFEVNLLGGSLPVDPAQFLALRGVALGVDDPATVVLAVAEAPEEAEVALVSDSTEHAVVDQGAVVELAVVLGDRLPTVGLRQVG